MKLIQKKAIFLLILVIIVPLVYLYLALIINKNIFAPTGLAYFNYLVQALQNHRLNLISPSTLDLSVYQNKWYLYWGPAPLVFILPFYLISGISASDIFYTVLAGIFNVFVFYFLIKEFIKYFNLSVSPVKQYLLTLSFAFASPNFYLSLSGRVWYTTQIVSIFYLLFFYLFYFKFLNQLNKQVYKLWLFIVAVIFVNLAWFSRYTLIFNLILLLYPLSVLYRKHHFFQFKICIFAAAFVTIFTFSLMFAYNQTRFNNPFETGIRYASVDPRYKKDLKEGKILSFAYLKHNLTYYFLNMPEFSINPLKLNINHEGNSVFAIYPYLIFVLPLIGRKFYKYRKQPLFILSAMVLLLNIGILLIYFATGWVQFGNRYLLDVIPLLFLLTLFIIQKSRLPTLIFVLCYGIFINLLGILTFYNDFINPP